MSKSNGRGPDDKGGKVVPLRPRHKGTPKGPNKLSPKGIKVAGRKLRALRMRADGKSYYDIARELKVSVDSVRGYVKAAQAEVAAKVREAATEQLTLDLMRLDEALKVVMPLVRQGDLGAVDRLVRLLESRARLLGLNAPDRLKVAAARSVDRRDLVHLSDAELEAIAARARDVTPKR